MQRKPRSTPAMSGTSFRVDLVILPLLLIQEERLSVSGEIHVLYTLSTGKLSPEGLPRNSVVGITELTLSVYRERKTRNQTNTFFPLFFDCYLFISCLIPFPENLYDAYYLK